MSVSFIAELSPVYCCLVCFKCIDCDVWWKSWMTPPVTGLILAKFYLCGKDCDRDKDVACDEERCHGWRPLWRASLSRVSLPAERKVGKLSCIIEHHDDKCDEKIMTIREIIKKMYFSVRLIQHTSSLLGAPLTDVTLWRGLFLLITSLNVMTNWTLWRQILKI